MLVFPFFFERNKRNQPKLGSEGTCSQADLLFEYVTNFNLRSDFEKRIHDQEQSSLRSCKMKF